MYKQIGIRLLPGSGETRPNYLGLLVMGKMRAVILKKYYMPINMVLDLGLL